MTDDTARTEMTREGRVEDLAEEVEQPLSDIDAMIGGIDVAQATRDFAKAHTLAAMRAEMLQVLPSLAAEITELTAAVRHYSPKAKVPRFEIAGAERLDLGDLAALKARGDALADVLDGRLAALEAEAEAAAEAAKTEVQRLRERVHALENPAPPPRLGTLPRHLTREFKDAVPPMCGGRDLATPRGATRLVGTGQAASPPMCGGWDLPPPSNTQLLGRQQAAEPLQPMLLAPRRHRLGGQAVLVADERYAGD